MINKIFSLVNKVFSVFNSSMQTSHFFVTKLKEKFWCAYWALIFVAHQINTLIRSRHSHIWTMFYQLCELDRALPATVGFQFRFLFTSSLKKVSQHRLHSKEVCLTCTAQRFFWFIAASLDCKLRMIFRAE